MHNDCALKWENLAKIIELLKGGVHMQKGQIKKPKIRSNSNRTNVWMKEKDNTKEGIPQWHSNNAKTT